MARGICGERNTCLTKYLVCLTFLTMPCSKCLYGLSVFVHLQNKQLGIYEMENSIFKNEFFLDFCKGISYLSLTKFANESHKITFKGDSPSKSHFFHRNQNNNYTK